jgi:hypothetical protein
VFENLIFRNTNISKYYIQFNLLFIYLHCKKYFCRNRSIYIGCNRIYKFEIFKNMITKLEKKIERPKVKRRLASREGCLNNLEEELPLFFRAHKEACENYNREVIQTPPESRCRGYEASLFNSKLIQSFQKYFPFDWKYGKYKRFILNKKGYLVLLKKLDSKGRPMNIKTRIVESINLQLTSSLFEESNYVEEPILFFGYKKDKFGNVYQPQLVYIDENQFRWAIEESDIAAIKTVFLEKPSESVATPIVRTAKKKAVNE